MLIEGRACTLADEQVLPDVRGDHDGAMANASEEPADGSVDRLVGWSANSGCNSLKPAGICLYLRQRTRPFKVSGLGHHRIGRR